MVTAIFDLIAEAVTGFFAVISDSLESVVGLFYKSGAEPGLTLVGTLMLIGLGVGLVWTLIRFVTGLVRGVAR